jgi:hypothetical protein
LIFPRGQRLSSLISFSLSQVWPTKDSSKGKTMMEISDNQNQSPSMNRDFIFLFAPINKPALPDK